MIVLVVLVTSAEPAAEHRFSREFVLTQMIPGTALGVVLGDLAYTWMAFRLARRSGRSDVTAMPLGLDTPSTFAVGAAGAAAGLERRHDPLRAGPRASDGLRLARRRGGAADGRGLQVGPGAAGREDSAVGCRGQGCWAPWRESPWR